MHQMIDLATDAHGVQRFAKYQDDPVGFIETVLGETLTEDTRRLARSVAANTITLAKSANATGKTHIAARIATWFLSVYDQVQVYTAAAPPADNLRRLLWGEIGDVLRRHPDIFKGYQVKSLEARRGPLDFMVGVTIPSTGDPAERVAKFSGKHRPHLLFIIDEGDAVPDEVYEGIETCMSGGTVVRLLVMFNPRAERGRVYRLERDGEAAICHLSAFNHPNVVTGREIIPGAVTRDITVDRINKYCRKLVEGERADRSTFELPEFLVGAQAKNARGDLWPPLRPGIYKPTVGLFSYMVLGRYPAQASDQLVSREWIDAAVSRWQQWATEHGEKPPKHVAAIQGVDVADLGDDLNVTFFRWGAWVEPAVIWSGVDVDAGALRCIQEYRKRHTLRACIDGTGVGAGIAPHMIRKGCSAHNVRVASSPTARSDMGEFRLLRDQLLWAYREWLRTDPAAMLPPDEALIEESLAATYTTATGKIEVSSTDELRDILKRSPDRLMAICQTFYQPRPLFEGWEAKGG